MGRRLCVLVSCTMIAVTLALFCEGQQAGKKYALLVGVNQYKHPDLTKLRFSENDVTGLAKVLQDGGYQVTLLRGNEATKAKIEERLGEILRQAERGDSVLVALAGHGLQFPEQKDGYFCPYEAKPFNDEIPTLVSLDKLYKDMQRSYADVKVLLVDACRNDGSRGTRGVGGDNAPRPPRGVAAYFSCAAGQVAYEHEKFQHGVFFHFVLEGLRGQAKNSRGQVTFSSLVDYTSANVAETVPELIGGGARQSPNFKADLEGASPVLLSGSGSGTAGGNAATISTLRPVLVIMDTSHGKIKIELLPEKAPQTVKNFLTYVDVKFYDGTVFHRVIDSFMIQGGGFEPGMKEKKTRNPIKNESANNLSNLRGTIAMARTTVPDSATAQFFINVKDNVFLDRARATDAVGYCVFGRVVEGMEVVDSIKGVPTMNSGPFADVPQQDVIIRSVRRAE